MRLIPYALAGLCLLAACRPSSPANIQVTGHATIKVVPDMVELSLKASNTRPAMKDAVQQTQTDINQILSVCRRYALDEEDIKVSIIATDKDYRYENNREIFDGYNARQVLDVRIRDIKKLEAFTEELMGTRISGIENIRYNHSKADSIQRVVNLMALSDAQKTAVKMCEQMSVRLGKVNFLANYPPNGLRVGGMQPAGSDYDLNLYRKSFGGQGFKMTAEILEFNDVAYAGFNIDQ
jgi:uncharacterized protein YggE